MPRKPAPAFVPPSTLGACADMLYETRKTRLLENTNVKELENREKILKDHIIATLPATETGAVGLKAVAMVETKIVPTINDWDTFSKWIVKKKRLDLLQRRLSEDAIKSLWDEGIEIPGVTQFRTFTLSVTKRG